MNRDDVIRMAQEAAAQHGHTIKPTNEIVETLTSFAALVAAHEREECARVCEETTFAWTEHTYYSGCMDCAKAIRARGNNELT